MFYMRIVLVHKRLRKDFDSLELSSCINSCGLSMRFLNLTRHGLESRIQKNLLDRVSKTALAFSLPEVSSSQHGKRESDSYYRMIESSIQITWNSLIHVESTPSFLSS
ncbi:hypothetical protein Tco_0566494 [Tanacetum coccineum]